MHHPKGWGTTVSLFLFLPDQRPRAFGECVLTHGPSPHAPAHGYRAETPDGVELVFRSDLYVYVLVGAWKTISKSKLPSGLRSEGKVKGKAKGPQG